MEEGEGPVLLGEVRKHVRHRGEDRHARRPAGVPVADAEKGGLPDGVLRCADAVQPYDGLGEDEADIVLQALVQLAGPVDAAVLFDGNGVDPDIAVPDLGVEGRNVVGEGVEGAAAGEIELGVVPVAGEDAVPDGAAREGEAHVGAPVVERIDLALGEKDEHGAALHGDDPAPVALEVVQRAHPDVSVYL